MSEPHRTDAVPEELRSLVEEHCAGTLSDEGNVRLESLLRESELYQTYFLEVMAVHAGLYWSLRDQSPASTPTLPAPVGDDSHLGTPALLEGLLPAAEPQTSAWTLPPSLRSGGWFSLGVAFLVAACISGVVLVSQQKRGPGEVPVAPIARNQAREVRPNEAPSPVDRSQAVARVDKLESQVLVERAGAKKPAVVGMELLADDSLDVPGGGSAELTLIGSARAKLGPRTTFVLGPGREGILREGFLQIDASGRQEGSLAIETPDAQARVEGARLAVGTSRKRTQIRVSEGRVIASRRTDGIEVEILEGYCSTIARASDPNPRPSGNGTALFVVSSKAIYAHEDWERFDQILAERIVGDRLWRSAMPVRVRTYDELDVDDFDGCSLIVLSVFPFKVGIEEKLVALKLPELSTPIVCLEPAAFPILGLTGPTRNVDFGFANGPLVVDVANPDHPLAAGFVGNSLKLFTYKKSPYAWGKPTSNALSIVRLHKYPERWLLFGYEQGAEMAKGKAPARRVGLFMDPVGIDYDTPTLDLIDASIDWCLDVVPPTMVPEYF